MKLRKLKLVTSIGLAVAVVLVLGLGTNYLAVSSKMKGVMQNSIDSQLAERLTMQEKIINSYVNDAEMYLIQFSTSPIVKETIKGKNTGDIQEYIKAYVSTADNVENVYVADMNSTVLASYVEPVIGKTLREGEALKQLQDALCGGMYNTGIMASKATGQQVISMYYPVYENGNMIGYVGAAVYSQNLQDSFESLGQKIMLIDALSKNYIFTEDDAMIGTTVEDEALLDIMTKTTGTQNPVKENITVNGQKMISISQFVPDRNWMLVTYTPYEDAFSGQYSLSRTMLLTNIGTIILVFIVLLISAKFALKDIVDLIGICNSLGTLDLRCRKNLDVYLDYHNEAGSLSNALDSLTASVTAAVTKVKSNSALLQDNAEKVQVHIENTNTMTSSVIDNMREIAQGAASQAKDIETATGRVIEIGELIEKTSKNLSGLMQNSSDMGNSSDAAEDTLASLTEMSKKTQQAVILINQKMASTSEATKEIKVATEVITNIAEETNLLALNASIEAARAGEAGRGFAVVAEQIKSLSEQSNESAAQIQKTIEQLVEEVAESTKTMESVSEIIGQQNEGIAVTEKSFATVKTCIHQSLDQINAIMEVMRVLDEKRQHIIDLVSNLSAISQENAATSEESTNLASALGEEMSSIMKEMDKSLQIAEELEKNIAQFTF